MLRSLSKDNTVHGMHVTVDGDGLVSLWDTQEVALAQDKAGVGTYLHLHLTNTQRALLMGAARRQQARDEATAKTAATEAILEPKKDA